MVVGEHAVRSTLRHEHSVFLEAIERTDHEQEMRSHIAQGRVDRIGRKERLPYLERRDLLTHRGKMPQTPIDSLDPHVVEEQRVPNRPIRTSDDAPVTRQQDLERTPSQPAETAPQLDQSPESSSTLERIGRVWQSTDVEVLCVRHRLAHHLIPGEEKSARLVFEHDVARRMAGGVSNLESEILPLEPVSVPQNPIDPGGLGFGLVDRQGIDSLGMQPLEEIFRHAVLAKERNHFGGATPDVDGKGFDDGCIGLMDQTLEVRARIPNRLNEAHVIPMGMRHDHPFDLVETMVEFFERGLEKSTALRRPDTRIDEG